MVALRAGRDLAGRSVGRPARLTAGRTAARPATSRHEQVDPGRERREHRDHQRYVGQQAGQRHGAGAVANLRANKGRCFQGPIPAGAGFVITEDEAQAMLARTTVNYRDVVRPYLTGDDIPEHPKQEPRRWIIDFAHLPLDSTFAVPVS